MKDSSIENMLGKRRAAALTSLEKSDTKNIIENVIEFIYRFAEKHDDNWSRYSFLELGHSNEEIARFIEIVDKFEFAELKLMLDINGLDSPEDWLEFAKFLVKAQHGNKDICRSLLERLAKVIIYKSSGFYKDKDFLRTFYKVPIR